MRAGVVVLGGACVVLGVAPGLLVGLLSGLAPWPAAAPPTAVGLHLPGTGSLPTLGIAVALAALASLFVVARGRRVAAPAPTWACGQLVEPQLNWTSAGFTKPLRLVLEMVLRPEREIDVHVSGGVVQEVVYSGRVPHLFDERVYRPVVAGALRAAHHARRLQTGRLGTYVAYLIGARARSARRRKARCDRMSGAALASVTVEIVGGFLLAPLLPGLIQHWKARLQGRRGPSPLQPYRELRRLWGKSAVNPEGAGVVYRLAPAVAAASAGVALLLVPVASVAPGLGVGRDVLALVGVLALARFAVAVASWDVSNGFSLMGASRDLTIAVSTEATLVLSVAVAALVAGTTSLPGIVAGTAGTGVWSNPALALGAVAFALVVIAETGRQPIDNPDTHLELTMIHEGPLAGVRRTRPRPPPVGCGGPPLDRARARRAGLPPASARRLGAARRARPGPRRPVRCARVDRDDVREDADPARAADARRRLADGAARHRLLPGGQAVSGALVWLLVALGLGVVVVRRRSVAVGLVTVQALLLAVAVEHAATGAKAAAATALAIRALALGALLLLVVSRTREPRPVRAGVAPLVRAGVAVAFALALTWLVPSIGLESQSAERGVLALVAFGAVTVATRRATLFQVLGIVLAENGLALAALELPGKGSSLAIELGVALDLTLIALVAAVFHERIFAEFGAGDSAALRSLRD